MFKLQLNDKEYIYFTNPSDDFKGYMYVSLFSNGEIMGCIKTTPEFEEFARIKRTKIIVFGDEYGRSAYPFDLDGVERDLTEEQIDAIEKFINELNLKLGGWDKGEENAE